MIKKFKSMISKALDGLFKKKKSGTVEYKELIVVAEDYEQRVTEEDAVSEEVEAWKKDIQIEQNVIHEEKLYGELVKDTGLTKNAMRVIARDQGHEYRYSGKLRKGFIH